jgi:hypothetical protein
MNTFERLSYGILRELTTPESQKSVYLRRFSRQIAPLSLKIRIYPRPCSKFERETALYALFPVGIQGGAGTAGAAECFLHFVA